MTSRSSSSEGAALSLSARGLAVTAGGARILSGVNLCFLAGELVALLGPSGSGKSTLLRALNGFRPGEGRVRLSGRDLYQDFEALKTRIGFVPQDDVLHTSLTVDKALTYAARLRLPADAGLERISGAVTAVLREVGLVERRTVRVRNLSGGQRKRVSVAMELLSHPPLLFLDEPTSGQDPALEGQMMALFRRLTGPERITVVTTHVLASLDEVDLAVMLAAGRLVYVGPPDGAPDFFGARDLPAVYRALAEGDAARFARRLEASSLYREHVLDRLEPGR
ncbi:MAG: ABC transporter ATP-binding protein [Myxococcales bacterium]|nr:ABC transporter ATP-binding protein [Myxococcales bacterium]